MPKMRRRRHIVLMPGMATAPRFMDAIGEALADRLKAHGDDRPSVQTVFPYGDWGRHLVLQLREISVDLACPRDAPSVLSAPDVSGPSCRS